MTAMFEEMPFFKKTCVSVYLVDEIPWKTSHDFVFHFYIDYFWIELNLETITPTNKYMFKKKRYEIC